MLQLGILMMFKLKADDKNPPGLHGVHVAKVDAEWHRAGGAEDVSERSPGLDTETLTQSRSGQSTSTQPTCRYTPTGSWCC